MNPTYIEFEPTHMDALVQFYRSYYNAEGGQWTEQTAYRRLHQIITMEDSLILLQVEGERLIGFLMGYFKQFDDSRGFYLEEILVAAEMQNRGYGSSLMGYLERELRRCDCDWIELLTTTDEPHQQFYRKQGFARSHKLVLEYLDLK